MKNIYFFAVIVLGTCTQMACAASNSQTLEAQANQAISSLNQSLSKAPAQIYDSTAPSPMQSAPPGKVPASLTPSGGGGGNSSSNNGLNGAHVCNMNGMAWLSSSGSCGAGLH